MHNRLLSNVWCEALQQCERFWIPPQESSDGGAPTGKGSIHKQALYSIWGRVMSPSLANEGGTHEILKRMGTFGAVSRL